MVRNTTLLLGCLALVACGGSDDDSRPCSSSADCLQGGVAGLCLPSTESDESWCAFPDPACISKNRWGLLAGDGLASTCVAPDDDVDAGPGEADAAASGDPDAAVPDAGPMFQSFDIAFVDGVRYGSSTTFYSTSQAARIINTGTVPLDLSTAEITNVIIDDDRHTVDVQWNNLATATIDPGFSGGALVPEASALIIDVGLVPEPAQDISQGYVIFNFSNPPPAGNWLGFHVEATLRIGNAQATMQIEVVHTGTSATATMVSASRISSVAVP